MLARVESSALSEQALQAWLDYGANPTRGFDSDSPFGDGMNPSALYQWTWEGRFDLVRQAVERAACPVPLHYKAYSQTYAPLLAVALARNHVDLAVWMILEQGCELDHLDDAEGRPCREFGKGDAFAEVVSRIERVDFKGSTPGAKLAKTSLKTRDGVL